MAMSRFLKIGIALCVDLILILLFLLRLYPYQGWKYFIYAFALILAAAFIFSYYVLERYDSAKAKSSSNYFMKPQ